MKNYPLSFSYVASLLGVALSLGLNGCSSNFGDVSNTPTLTTMHIQGIVHGGQQPISGAHVYMYAASTAAYGGNGIAAKSGTGSNASTSLLTAATEHADSKGLHYVITNAAGSFDINGDFACTPTTQVYLYSTGGNPQLAGVGAGGTVNSAATLLAVVGDCASATPSAAFPNATTVSMNELSTVAAAYALAGFATDPLHIGAPSAVSGHSLSAIGLANAFNMALNLVNQAAGTPNATLPLNSKAVVPVTTINTLGDILAACVNSTGVSSSGCNTLFTNTTYSTKPTDTATAAINIAQHPGTNVSNLLALATNASPFQTFLTTANDFSIGINYTGTLSVPFEIAVDDAGNAWVANSVANSVVEFSSAGKLLSGANGYGSGGGLNEPFGIAIDGSGNAWVTNLQGNSVTKLSSTGAVLSGTNGYTGGGLDEPQGIAIDSSGDVWVANVFDAVTKLSSTGALLSGTHGYTGSGTSGGQVSAQAIAIDGAGNAWVSDQNNLVTELSSTGAFLSGTGGYSGGGLDSPDGIAIDSLGDAWVVNVEGKSVTKFSNTGAFLSGTGGDTGGGLSFPEAIAIDGSGNAWVANSGGNSVIELSSAGTALSGTKGYTGGGLSFPEAIAIDGSGNAWVTNLDSDLVTEMIGIATPVITPIVAGLPATPTAKGTSNLGTRP
ncbi:NHL repeat-containing protein [Granulicella mallensis]|uniref:NHL repeat containing protein n=1 Tax=Granulicella mallensis TaxID=940614 RepID=A0A7W7ZQB5_9BACT|nr:NHL repeat-containing protein [Granulicella mallensis]MBB5064180.1 hypothetical protein [Granulicella mallensis]